MTPYPPHGKYPSDFARRNQAVLAERLRWPVGALEACRRLEDEYPGWRVSWLSENNRPGFERPAGFWAELDGMHHARVFATTPRELARRMGEVPPHDWSTSGCAWCTAEVDARLKRAGL